MKRSEIRRDTPGARRFAAKRSSLQRHQPMRRAPGLSRRGFGRRGDFRDVSVVEARERAQGYREPWQENPKPGPCRNCGHPYVEMHHAVPRSLSRAGRDDPRNWLPLCRTCHNAWHGGLPIYRDVFSPAEWEFLNEIAPSPGWLGRRYPVRPPMEEAA